MSYIFTQEENSIPFPPPRPMGHRPEYMQTAPPPSAALSEVLGRIQAEEEGIRAVKLNPISSKPPVNQM